MPELSRRRFLVGSAAAAGVLAVSTAADATPSTSSPGRRDGPPPLDELAGQWMLAPEVLHPPAVNNFWGGLQTTANLVSFDSLTFAPLSQGGECFRMAAHGAPVQAEQSRWYPHQVMRRGHVGDIVVESTVRMGFEQQVVMIDVSIHNPTKTTVMTPVSVELSAHLREFEGAWEWAVPRPTDAASIVATIDQPNRVCVVTDQISPAVSAVAFAGERPTLRVDASGTGQAEWQISLAPHRSTSIRLVLVTGVDRADVLSRVTTTAARFSRAFDAVAHDWQLRWEDVFTPGNKHYSGHLPTLVTDDASLRRLYYMSVMTILQVERTQYSAFPRVFVSCGPEWAVSLTYFWDTSFIAALLAMLDPEVLRDQLMLWLRSDIYDGYAVDMQSGQLVGPWYSANDLSVFTTALTYYDYTGDRSFLDATVGDAKVIDRLESIALHWQELVDDATGLADYGGLSNLLEEVPDYINQVPSLNAANVWMMRQTARLRHQRGETSAATDLQQTASELAQKILALYVPGQGVWQSVHDDGTRVAVRHVYDFDTVTRSMTDDLTAAMQKELATFASDELQSTDWMRALSLRDRDAAASLRPDHGSNGAYDSWPALAASAMARLGDYPQLVSMLRRFAGVTTEGPFSQSHQLVPEFQGVLVWDRPELNPIDALTVEAWIEPRSWPEEIWQASIVSKDVWQQVGDSWLNYGYVLRGGAGGRISFVVAVEHNLFEVQSTTTVSTGRWHHVAGVYDGRQIVVYIDGQAAGAVDVTGALSAASGWNLCVGLGSFDTARRFSGAVNEVGVYARALTAAEIARRATAKPGARPPADAVCLLPMRQKSGSTTVDTVSGIAEPVLGGRWITGPRGEALATDPTSADTVVRISPAAQLQDFNASNGGSFAATIIQDLFGFQPVAGAVHLRDPRRRRGFTGTLKNVPTPKGPVTVASTDSGVVARRPPPWK